MSVGGLVGQLQCVRSAQLLARRDQRIECFSVSPVELIHCPRRYWRYGDQAYYILRERYARGEITKDQLDQMMRDLQQHNQGYQNI